MSQWYYASGNASHGPVSVNQLKQLLANGRQLNADSLVWREGMPDWRPLRSVDELRSIFQSAGYAGGGPPPPPPHQPAANIPVPVPAAERSGNWPWINIPCPGFAHAVYGQPGKGAVTFASVFVAQFILAIEPAVGLLAYLAIIICSIIDAFMVRKKLQRTGSVGPWEFFPR